jgi:hypothetical protein
MPLDFVADDEAAKDFDFQPEDSAAGLQSDLNRFIPTKQIEPPPSMRQNVEGFLQRTAEIPESVAGAWFHPGAAIEKANQLGVDLLSKFGVYPKGTQGFKPFTTPLVSGEQVTDAFKSGVAQPLGLSTAPDEGVLGDIETGAGKFAAENISELTKGENIIPMALGAPPVQRALGVTEAAAPQVSEAVARSFQLPMIAQIPESVKSIEQAQTPSDVIAATLGAGATIGLPLAIQKGINASQIRPSAKVYGDVRARQAPAEGVPVPERGAGIQPQTEISKERPEGILLEGELGGKRMFEDEQVAAAERQAIDEAEKLGSPASVVDQFSGESPDEPFAGQFMRPTGKGMEIRKQNFRDWLLQIPEERRPAAIAQRVLEEHIHRNVPGEDAAAYWDTLTKAEQIAEHRAYTGKWTQSGLLKDRGVQFSDTQLGHEAIRRRMQRLMNGTTSEIAEAAMRERWTLKSLDALSGMVRNVREMAGSRAAGEGLRLLSQLDDNLKAARSAITGGQAPAAFDKNAEGAEKEAARVAEMAPDEFASWAKSTGRGATGAGYDLAKKYGEAGRETLEKFAKQQEKETVEALGRMRGAKPDELGKLFAETTQRSARKQFFDEGLRLLDAGQEVRSGMSPEEAAQKHGVGVEDVRELSTKEQPAAFQKDYSERIGDNIRDSEKQADEYRRLAKGATSPVQAMRYQRESDRFQNNADAMKRAVPDWEQRSTPAAFSKKKPDTLTDPMQFGAGEKGKEREVFAAPVAKDIEATATKHVTEALAKDAVPNFEEFRGELQSKYGGGMTPEKAFYPWTDAIQKHLLTATGKSVRAMLGKLGLVDDVAQALKPQEKDPFLGSIPDAEQKNMDQFALEMQTEAQTEAAARRQSRASKDLKPDQKRRLAALGAIYDKLAEQAGGKPKRSSFRSEVGPEDIASRFIVIEPAEPIPGEGGVETGEFTQPNVETSRQFRAFTPDQAADPKLVGDAVTANARVKGEKVSLTKGLLALRDKINNRTILVSAWEDGRRGPVVTNPEGAGNSVKIDSKLFQRYEPTHQMTLRDPVEDFRKVFTTPEAFAGWFGDAGIEGTRGIKTSSFTGPEAGVARERAGITTPGKPSPSNPFGFIPDEPAPSKTGVELKTPRFGRQSVPAEPLPPKVGAERPVPPPGGPMLSLEAQAALDEAPSYSATVDRPSPELEARGIDISPYARGERPGGAVGRKFRKPEKIAPRGTIPAKDLPAAFDKAKAAAKEQWDISTGDIKDIFSRRAVKQEIPALLDGADSASGQIALNAREAIKLASTDKTAPGWKYSLNPFSKMTREQRANAAEATQRRKASIAYIAAGQTDAHGNWTANKSKIVDWRAKLDIAEAKARSWTQDLNPLKRREGRRWMKAVKEMQAGVEYANTNWTDRTFVEGAQAYRKEVHDAIEFEKLHGSTTVERDNYIPGLFHGDYFAGKRLLGTQYRMPKKFQNPYDAIAAGPYYLASQDVAELAQTRIMAGRRSVERMLWTQALTGIKDPATGKAVATQPNMAMKNVVDPTTGLTSKEPVWQSPSPDYELVFARANSKPIAVHRGYAGLVRTLIRPDVIADLPLGKEALAATGILKHGVLLLLDSFHLARLGQYGKAIGGKDPVGYRGGHSALSYRAGDLQAAVDKGYISKAAADWATGEVELTGPGGTKVKVTRKAIADELLRHGLNASKITDALYKDAVQNIPFIGEAYHKAISPYNRFLFDRFLPGMMIENAVRSLEQASKAKPGTPLPKLARDVIKDINTIYGNLGRQGIFKSATFRSLGQLVMLAPMWQEGLIRKEITAASRIAALPLRGAAALMGKELPYRKGLPALGTTGKMMATGLGTYFALTQLINLITRKQPTWQNEEEGHKWDAFIPIGEKGVWLSPMAVFAETTHDFIRLGETKPQVFDRIVKMGENRLGPVGKMANIFWKGEDPMGYRYSTSGARLRAGLAQVTPGAGAVPITIGTPLRAAGHALFPNQIAPNPPGALPRQLLASGAGIKVQAGQTAVNQVYHLADQFMEKEGLKKDTGWEQVMTDDPSYSKLRTAIRNGDTGGASKIFTALQKSHSDKDIIKAMKLWAKSPFTRSKRQNEHLFQQSLSDKELEIYTRANEERQDLLDQFYDFMNAQP